MLHTGAISCVSELTKYDKVTCRNGCLGCAGCCEVIGLQTKARLKVFGRGIAKFYMGKDTEPNSIHQTCSKKKLQSWSMGTPLGFTPSSFRPWPLPDRCQKGRDSPFGWGIGTDDEDGVAA